MRLLKIGETFINPDLITRFDRIRHREASAPQPVRYRIWLGDGNPEPVTTGFGADVEIFEAWLNRQCVAEDALDVPKASKKKPESETT